MLLYAKKNIETEWTCRHLWLSYYAIGLNVQEHRINGYARYTTAKKSVDVETRGPSFKYYRKEIVGLYTITKYVAYSYSEMLAILYEKDVYITSRNCECLFMNAWTFGHKVSTMAIKF